MVSNSTLRTFAGATAIITGGASGIGRALAEELAKRGGEVVLADLQIELAEEVVIAIQAAGGKAEAVKLDVADSVAVEQLVQETVKRTGRLDYIFNNAGIGIGGDLNHYSIEDWNYILDVNLRGVIHGVQAAYQVMLDQGFGHIVNTASLAGLIPSPGVISYATTKYAVVGLSQSLRAAAAPLGIRVSVFCPGFVRTAILSGGGKYGRTLIEMSPDQERNLQEVIEKFKPLPANIFARKALDLVARNKAIIVLPSWWKLFWWLNRLSPSLGLHLAQKHLQDFREKLGVVKKG